MTTRRIVSDAQLTREEMLAAIEGNAGTLEDWDDIADASALKVLDRLLCCSDAGHVWQEIRVLRDMLRA